MQKLVNLISKKIREAQVGDYLKRGTRGKSLRQIAVGSGVSASTLSRITQNKLTVDLVNVDKLVKYFNIDVKVLDNGKEI